MPSFARELETTLHNALGEASKRRHEYATLEHLLMALIDDTHASQVMTACGDHGAANLESRDVARARRRRIDPHSLEQVGTVDPGGGNFDQHFARTGAGGRPRDQPQLLWATGRGDFDGAHHVRNHLAH